MEVSILLYSETKITVKCRVVLLLVLLSSPNLVPGNGGATGVAEGDSSVFEKPYTSLKEYTSFQDAKIYALYVPEYTSKMMLNFQYIGYYSGSHKACNRTIIVLLKHGSPSVPYKDDISINDWLYNDTYAYKTVISYNNLNKVESKTFTSPLPGYWYVTAFLPYVKTVKKIKEKGLSKPDDKCLCAVEVNQVLRSPKQSLVVIGKGQTVTHIDNSSRYNVRYYQYFVPGYSKNLNIGVTVHCPKKLSNCSLSLAVSAKSLPSGSETRCVVDRNHPSCVLLTEWPQPGTTYYVEVNGISPSYELTANHTDCKQNASACYPIYVLANGLRSRLRTYWEGYRVINTTLSFFSVYLEPNNVGTTLTFALRPRFSTARTTFKICICKDSPPFNITKSHSLSQQHCSVKNNSDIFMHVLFPQPGNWYIGVKFVSSDAQYYPMYDIDAKTTACLDPTCSGHGSCVVRSDVGISYGVCLCDYGYSGWTCSNYHGLDILAICLLTISNIAFVPGIIVAYVRRFYPEAIVYLFNMYCSTVYHACDSHGRCIYDYNTLQLSDFFASVLSVWFTLMAMVKLPSLWHRTVNIFGLLCLFVGVQISRFGVTVIVVPVGVGLGIVLLSFAIRSYGRKKCFPRCRRWLLFLLPAAVLAVVAIVVYTCLETTSNYKYLHSVWHICIALCIPLLLPSVRKPKSFTQEYNMIQQLEDGENFRDSDESLLLIPFNGEQNDREDANDAELTDLPQLIA